MLVATILALSLAILTFLFHYAVLRWLSGGMARIAMTAGVRILVIVIISPVVDVRCIHLLPLFLLLFASFCR